jgi:hypothetical protein
MILLLFFRIFNLTNIKADSPLSIIDFFDTYPNVQLKNHNLSIICIVKENIEIQKIELFINYPNGYKETTEMLWSNEGKYIYNTIFNLLGNYSYYIILTDNEHKEIKTISKYFWITIYKEDTDNDGMPNWWETKYGLNPENPTDALKNNDGDEYTNLIEYRIGTNPLKDIFLQNISYRLRHNILYLISSLLLFILIVNISIFGLRRRSI